jgi:hypothetical protein
MKFGSSKTKTEAPNKPQEPQKSPEQLEADRIIARANRLEKLGNEAAMWRAFATGCKDGRWLMEECLSYLRREDEPRLNIRMDADTAPMWKDFALRMAADRESRLRDMLNCEVTR